jgi:hypothetical protein
MSADIQATTTSQSQLTPAPLQVAERNPAVVRCFAAYKSAHQKAKSRGKTEYEAAMEGEAAYRDAFPSLCGLQNIADFIACVAHAILVGVVKDAEGPRLLYAAQVASSALRAMSSAKKPSQEKRADKA